VDNIESVNDGVQKVIQPYTSVDTMPADAKSAYDTYNKLAKKIAEFSKEQE
jgi:hypothetical protein